MGQNSASWNPVVVWLERLDGLRRLCLLAVGRGLEITTLLPAVSRVALPIGAG